MNKSRRKELQEVVDKLEEARGDLESLRDEEQEFFDNMPENMQQGEKGETAQSAIDELTEAHDNVQSAIEQIGSVIGA